MDAQRHHLFEAAVTETAKRLHSLGWERIVLCCEREIATRFRQTLPAELSERVIAESDVNLLGEEPAAIADALEGVIDEAWARRTAALVDLARERAQAGGAAALGAEETFGALSEGRVAHLVLDPEQDFSARRRHDSPAARLPGRADRRACGGERGRHRRRGDRGRRQRLAGSRGRRRHPGAAQILSGRPAGSGIPWVPHGRIGDTRPHALA